MLPILPLLLALAPPLQDEAVEASPALVQPPLLAPELASDEPARHDGAAFDVQLVPGMAVNETGNGQVHFLELRRPGIEAVRDEPLVRLLAVPGAAAQLDAPAFLGMLENELIGLRLQEGYLHRGTEDASADFLGEERAGRRIAVERQGRPERFELFAVERDGHLLAVQTRAIEGLDSEALIAELLASVTLDPLTTATTRREALGPFTVDVPLVTAEERRSAGPVSSLQLGFPEGMLELVHQELADRAEATLAPLNFWSQRRKQVADLAAANQATTAPARWCGVWVGDGLVEGETQTVTLADGAVTEVASLAVDAGTHLLGSSFEARADVREAMTARARAVLGSLAMPASPEDLREGLGQLLMRQDHGLTWTYPRGLRMVPRAPETPGGPARLTLASPRQGVASRSRFFVDVHRAPLEAGSEGSLADEVRAEVGRLVAAEAPDVVAGEGWQVQARLLDEDRVGWTQAFTDGDRAMHLTAVAAPHRGGSLLAGAVYPAADSGDSLWVLANLVARLEPLPDGPRDLTTVAWRLRYDPAAWALGTKRDATTHLVDMTPRDGDGWLIVTTELLPRLAAERGVDALVARARASAEQQRGGQVVHLDLPLGTPLEREITRALVPLGGSLAVHERDVVRAPGLVAAHVFDHWTLRGRDRVVTLRAMTRLDDPEGRARAEEVVASLALAAPQAFPARTAFGAGLALDLPPELLASRSLRGSDAYLELVPALAERELMSVRSRPVGPDADRARLREDLVLQAELLAMLDPRATERAWDLELTGTLAGQPALRTRCEARHEGRVLLVVETLQTVTDGILREATILSDPNLEGSARETLLGVAAAARPIPMVAHLCGERLCTEFDPGRFHVATGDLAISSTAGRGQLDLDEAGEPRGSGDPAAVAALLSEALVHPVRAAETELRLDGRLYELPLPPGTAEEDAGDSFRLVSEEAGAAFELWGLMQPSTNDATWLGHMDLLQDLATGGAEAAGMTLVRRELLGAASIGRRFRAGGRLHELHLVPLDGDGAPWLALRASWDPSEGAAARAAVDLVLDGLAPVE